MSTEPPPRNWRGLVGVLTAQAVALTGTRMSAIALPWFVLTATGSAVQTGAIVFVEMTPYVIFQLLSGPVIDRGGPRRISIAGDLVSMVAVGLVPLLFAVGALPMGVLMSLVAVAGALRGPSDAAKAVFIPAATKAARVPLERGTGFAATIERLASTVGPAAGGAVVASLGGPYALAITAALSGLSAVIVAATAPPDQKSASSEHAAGYLARLRDGATFIRQEKLLRSMAGMLALTNLLDAAWSAVLLPVWARETGNGPAAIGLLLGVMMACAALFSMLAAIIGHRLPRRPVYLVGFLLCGAPRFIVLALGVPLWVTVGVYALSGFGAGFLNPIIGAILFERSPPAMFGRVRTLLSSLSSAGIPFGGLIGGSLVTVFGLTPALIVCGAVYFAATTLPGLQKAWSEMDRARRP